MRRSGLQAARRGVHHAHGICDGDELPAVALGATEARQDERLGAGHHVRSVEFGGDVHGQGATVQRGCRGVGVGRGGHEVAAQAEEHADRTLAHGPGP